MEKNNAYTTEELSEHIRGIDLSLMEKDCISVPKLMPDEPPYIMAVPRMKFDQKMDFFMRSGLAEEIDRDPYTLVASTDVTVLLLSYFPDTLKLVVEYDDPDGYYPYTQRNINLTKADKAFLREQLDKFIIENTDCTSQQDYIAVNCMSGLINPFVLNVVESKNSRNHTLITPLEVNDSELRELFIRGNIGCSDLLLDYTYCDDLSISCKHRRDSSLLTVKINYEIYPIPMAQSELDKIRQDAHLDEFWEKIESEYKDAECLAEKVAEQKEFNDSMLEIIKGIKPEDIQKIKYIPLDDTFKSTIFFNETDGQKILNILSEFKEKSRDNGSALVPKRWSPILEIISSGTNDTATAYFKYNTVSCQDSKMINGIKIDVPREFQTELNSKIGKNLGISLKRFSERSFKCILKNPTLTESDNLSVKLLVSQTTLHELFESVGEYLNNKVDNIGVYAIISPNKEVSLDLKLEKHDEYGNQHNENYHVKTDERVQKDILESFEEKYGSVDKCFKKKLNQMNTNKKKVGMGM